MVHTNGNKATIVMSGLTITLILTVCGLVWAAAIRSERLDSVISADLTKRVTIVETRQDEIYACVRRIETKLDAIYCSPLGKDK